jgi:hypothetical protein
MDRRMIGQGNHGARVVDIDTYVQVFDNMGLFTLLGFHRRMGLWEWSGVN